VISRALWLYSAISVQYTTHARRHYAISLALSGLYIVRSGSTYLFEGLYSCWLYIEPYIIRAYIQWGGWRALRRAVRPAM